MNKEKILKAALKDAEKIVKHLFPAAVKLKNKMYIGDIRGNPGNSLVIELEGEKCGLWHDFATDEGGDILSLYGQVRNLYGDDNFPILLKEIADFLGINSGTLIIKNKPSGEWIYFSVDNKPIVKILRYDNSQGKSFYPFDMVRNKYGLPDPRPLYNLPLISKSEEIILVEGEKCAEAITKLGICGTTAPGGANTILLKTDWKPLRGKTVIIWPDNDEPGKLYAHKIFSYLVEDGIKVSILEIPEGKPHKWDCADAVAEGFNVIGYIKSGKRYMPDIVRTTKKELIISEWNANRYSNKPKAPEFLVDNIFPLSAVSMIAAVGDTGKSMLILDLALKIAVGIAGTCFGNNVRQKGAAVLFTAEDDKDEIERRLNRLDPEGYRYLYPDKLFIIPLQNVAGSFPIVTEKPGDIYETEDFLKVKKQLIEIKDLKLVVFDPLSSFVNGDITFSSNASAFLMNSLSRLAVETKSSVIITHHLRKTGGEINEIDDVREAIRGSSALVNGVRLAYAFWPLKQSKQREFFKNKEKDFKPNSLYNGAVVKANNKVDREIKVYLRDETTGLLKVVNGEHTPITDNGENEEILFLDIVKLNRDKVSLKYTGREGVFEKRELLSKSLRKESKRYLRALVLSLIECGRVIKESTGELKAVVDNEINGGDDVKQLPLL